MTVSCVLSLAPPPDICTCLVVEQVLLPPARPRYDVRLAHRFEPPLPLARLIGVVYATLRAPELRGQTDLLLEGPIACQPWMDQFRSHGLACTAVQLQDSGSAPTHVGSNWVVSPYLLAGTQELLLQEDRLVFPDTLPNLPMLTEEAQVLRSLREGTALSPRRLPLAMSVALACWWAELGSATFPADLDLASGVRGTTRPAPDQRHRQQQSIPPAILRAAARQWGLEGETSYPAPGATWEEQKRELYAQQLDAAEARSKEAQARRREEGGFQGAT
jgi:hypothetical protein